MKININLLRTILNINTDFNKLVEKLTLIGFESIIINEYLDVNIPYNREDCNSVFGILRELSRFDYNFLREFENRINKYKYTNKTTLIKIFNKKFCPLFCFAIIKNLKIKSKLPFYIKDVLINNNINDVNPLVNVLNYITFLTGHPLHAYNLISVKDDIKICKTKKDINFFTINNEKILVKKKTFLVKSGIAVVSIPGIIGSYNSKITDSTTDIFIESAFFNKDLIKIMSEANNIQTESARKFINGVDIDFVEFSLFYAINLIIELFEGDLIALDKIATTKYFPKHKNFIINKEKLNSILGFKIDENILKKCFDKIDLYKKNFKESICVKIPYYRSDIRIVENIYSEIIKTYGYDNIIKIKPKINLFNIKIVDNNFTVRSFLKNSGFNEIISYSFVDSFYEKILTKKKQSVFIKNPLSNNFNVMRSNLIHGLLKSMIFNIKRQNYNLKLFECGNAYSYCNDKYLETTEMLSVAITNKNRDVCENFLYLKKKLEGILSSVYNIKEFYFFKNDSNIFDKEINAKVMVKEYEIAEIGVLNKRILNSFSINQNVCFFSLKLSFNNNYSKTFNEISKYPSVTRDLSIILNENITYNDILFFLKKIIIIDLVKISFIDSYYINNERKKSFTLRFKFQNKLCTLLDKNIVESMDLIKNELKKAFDINIKT